MISPQFFVGNFLSLVDVSFHNRCYATTGPSRLGNQKLISNWLVQPSSARLVPRAMPQPMLSCFPTEIYWFEQFGQVCFRVSHCFLCGEIQMFLFEPLHVRRCAGLPTCWYMGRPQVQTATLLPMARKRPVCQPGYSVNQNPSRLVVVEANHVEVALLMDRPCDTPHVWEIASRGN